jgi:hypothetical protein
MNDQATYTVSLYFDGESWRWVIADTDDPPREVAAGVHSTRGEAVAQATERLGELLGPPRDQD